MTDEKLGALVVSALFVFTAVVGAAPLTVTAAGNTGNVPVTGTLYTAGNSAVTTGFVYAHSESWDHADLSPIEASGNFEITAYKGRTYSFGHYQHEEGENGAITFPRDGTPDVYSLGSETVSDGTTLGRTTLPEAHLLTVTVVDQYGDPVFGANVSTFHQSEDGSVAGWRVTTNSEGQLQNYQNAHTGIEVVGDVQVVVDPPTASLSPDGAVEYADEMYTRNITVTEDRELEIVVDATRSDQNNGGSPERSGGGGGGGGGQTSPVAVTFTNGTAAVSFEPPAGGEVVRAPLGDGVVAGDVTVDRVAVVPVFGFGFDLTVSGHDSRPADVPALQDHTAVGFFSVEKDGVKNGELEEATLKFTVDETAVPGDPAAADVVLYRYHDGEWQALETEHKRGTTYLATSPGFSRFAIGIDGDQPDESQSTQSTQTATPTTTPTITATSTTTDQPSSASFTSTTTTTESPGFGILIALAAFAFVAALARRR